jgi:hypothetical protein
MQDHGLVELVVDLPEAFLDVFPVSLQVLVLLAPELEPIR